MGTKTQRLMSKPDVEAVFQAFVRNANALATQSRTVRADFAPAHVEASPVPPPVSLESMSLADRRNDPGTMADADPFPLGLFDVPDEATDLDASHVDFAAVQEPPDTQEIDTAEAAPVELVRRSSRPPAPNPLVPDVASIAPPPPPVPEGSEHGEIPPRELERTMQDMSVLLRYGHMDEVAQRLDELHARYPDDLLLLRRIAEFHLQTGSAEAAKDCLFRLARRLFERRNVDGMRAALQQILVLEPRNPQAHRLLSLLDRRG
ncbi:MAG: tetratricopeptide repeat protein [Myxococcota bacterium]